MKGKLKLRPQVGAFASEMNRVLDCNRYKGHWRNTDLTELENLLDNSVKHVKELKCFLELADRFSRIVDLVGGRPTMGKIREALRKECADVGNISMMIADNFGNLCDIYDPEEEEENKNEIAAALNRMPTE